MSNYSTSVTGRTSKFKCTLSKRPHYPSAIKIKMRNAAPTGSFPPNQQYRRSNFMLTVILLMILFSGSVIAFATTVMSVDLGLTGLMNEDLLGSGLTNNVAVDLGEEGTVAVLDSEPGVERFVRQHRYHITLTPPDRPSKNQHSMPHYVIHSRRK